MGDNAFNCPRASSAISIIDRRDALYAMRFKRAQWRQLDDAHCYNVAGLFWFFRFVHTHIGGLRTLRARRALLPPPNRFGDLLAVRQSGLELWHFLNRHAPAHAVRWRFAEAYLNFDILLTIGQLILVCPWSASAGSGRSNWIMTFRSATDQLWRIWNFVVFVEAGAPTPCEIFNHRRLFMCFLKKLKQSVVFLYI